MLLICSHMNVWWWTIFMSKWQKKQVKLDQNKSLCKILKIFFRASNLFMFLKTFSFETLLMDFMYHSHLVTLISVYLPLTSSESVCMSFRWASRQLSASPPWCVPSWRSRSAGRSQPRYINAKETSPVTSSPTWSPSPCLQVLTISWWCVNTSSYV